MAVERIGYRRLYDSIGCSLVEANELSATFSMGELQASVYLGPKPTLGIFISHSDKYVVPGETSTMLKCDYKKDATKSGFPHNFFTEIICSKLVEVPQAVSLAFHAKEKTARDQVLSLAEKDARVLMAATDLIAGTLGLRFHRQFVLELINENFFALMGEDDVALNFAGSGLEVLEGVSLNPKGKQELSELLQNIGQATPEAREFGASALAWLLRAWRERDIISKFMALFIPIEIILEGYRGNADDENKNRENGVKIRDLLQEHGGKEAANLLAFFNRLIAQYRPGIALRFEDMAKKAKQVGWESDVVAFRRFNSIRNKLLHKGEQQIQLVISLSKELGEITCQLEDIAERYVSLALFGDGQVYPSRWRPQRTKTKA